MGMSGGFATGKGGGFGIGIGGAFHRNTQLFRPTDLVARFGGEELVVLLPNTTLDGARLVAERIKSQVDGYAIPHAASSVSKKVSVSIGLATLEPVQGGDALALLLQAENALCQAKKRGRNLIQAYRDVATLTLAKG